MAARWCWALLLCQLAAWGSAAPQETENSHGKANAPEFSSHQQQLTDSTQGASRTSIGSANHNSPQIIQNKQPEALQQHSVKPKETEDSSVNSHSAAAASSNTEKDTKKVKESQTGISDTLSLPKSETTELKQREGPSIKTPNVKLEDPAQERNPVQTKTVQENSDRSEEPGTDASHSELNKKPKQSENVELKPKPTSAKVDSSEVTNTLPKSKTKELKQGGDQTVKTSNVNPDNPNQDSFKKNSVQTKTVQKNPDRLEESETDDSHLDLNVKKLEQSEDVEPENLQPGQSVKKPTSAKVDSSEVTKPVKSPSLPIPKTKELKQGEDQSTNVNPGGPAQAKNKKTDTDISHPDFSELETNDEESQQIEDALAKDQDLQLDPSAKHPQKSNPVESQNVEEEVVDPGDEQENGLDDKKTKIANHEEDSEGTPKNGSENSHFFAYLVTTAIVVAALYIAYHNKRKIIAFALEGKKSKTARRPKSSDYQRLDQKI